MDRSRLFLHAMVCCEMRRLATSLLDLIMPRNHSEYQMLEVSPHKLDILFGHRDVIVVDDDTEDEGPSSEDELPPTASSSEDEAVELPSTVRLSMISQKVIDRLTRMLPPNRHLIRARTHVEPIPANKLIGGADELDNVERTNANDRENINNDDRKDNNHRHNAAGINIIGGINNIIVADFAPDPEREYEPVEDVAHTAQSHTLATIKMSDNLHRKTIRRSKQYRRYTHRTRTYRTCEHR